MPERPTTIVHIISRPDWDEAVRQGVVAPPSLETEGFVHCSTVEQVCDTATRYYAGSDVELLLLALDVALLDSEVRWEESHPGEWFPHVYGPVPVRAVEVVASFPRADDGSFTLPPAIRS